MSNNINKHWKLINVIALMRGQNYNQNYNNCQKGPMANWCYFKVTDFGQFDPFN